MLRCTSHTKTCTIKTNVHGNYKYDETFKIRALCNFKLHLEISRSPALSQNEITKLKQEKYVLPMRTLRNNKTMYY